VKGAILLPFLLVLVALPCLAREALPRNPFWPQGVSGRRYPISAEPRFRLDVQTPATNDVKAVGAELFGEGSSAADPTDDPIWAGATKALRFGSTLNFQTAERTQSAVTINGRIYAVGELVSVNYVGHRFTWRIESLSSDGKIRLKRITYRNIGLNQ